MPARTILLVDPDPLQRQLIDMLLAEDGHHIVNTGTGREALEFLKEHTPDLVIMEIALPDIGGDVVCRKLKSVSRLSRVPVILTAEPPGRSGLPADLRDVARAVGADQLLQKPLGDKNVRERVRQLLGHWDASATPARKPMKNTVILEEALVDLEAGSADTFAHDAATSALYNENEDLRREVASLKRRLARLESGMAGRGDADISPNGFVPGAPPASPTASARPGDAHADRAGGDRSDEGPAPADPSTSDPPSSGEPPTDQGDLQSRVRDLERRNKALLAALEAAKAEVDEAPRGLFGRRRR